MSHDQEKISDYIKSPEFSRQDYIDSMAGVYKNWFDPSVPWQDRYTREALKRSKHNNKTNNDAVIEALYDKLKTEPAKLKKKIARLRKDPIKNALYKLQEEVEDSSSRFLTVAQVKNITGMTPKQLGLYVDSDNEVGVRGVFQDLPPAEFDARPINSQIERLLATMPLSSKMLTKIITSDNYKIADYEGLPHLPVNSLIDNPNIKKEHLYRIATHHPHLSATVLGHSLADERLADIVFRDEESIKQASHRAIENYLYDKVKINNNNEIETSLPQKRIKDLLEYAPDKVDQSTLAKLLSVSEPEHRRDWINRKLGISGGNYAAQGIHNEDQSDSWNNWENGPEYDQKLSNFISGTNLLDEDQIEHIKRHGNFYDRYELYHNKNIDPKHGQQMFKLWHDDEQDKGYDAEQLINHYKEFKDTVFTPEDLPTELRDEILEGGLDSGSIDDATRERYDFSDWLSSNSERLARTVNLDDSGVSADNILDTLSSDYDWTGPNPKSENYHGDPKYQALDALYDRAEGGYDVSLDQFQEATGLKDPKELGLELDSNLDITADDIVNKINDYGGPSEIDYENNDYDLSIHDHPEFDERYRDTQHSLIEQHMDENPYHYYDDFYEDYQNSDEYEEAFEEEKKEYLERVIYDEKHYDPLYENSHQDERFIPDHVAESIPEIAEIRAARKRKQDEQSIGSSLDSIPNRSYEHHYGENQYLYETLKDYADAAGGKIDIGRMHKLFPAQKEQWKKIFGNQGKLDSEQIQQKIDALPKTPYEISYGSWKGNKMQNLNNRDQIVFRLDHSEDSVKPLKEDKDLFNTFQKIQDVSIRSGHPTNPNTIAWARVDTSDPKHWFIDEVQSDFGSTVTQYLKDNNEEEKAKHVRHIADFHKDWREALVNHVIKEAKKHGVERISTHSPESKSAHTGSGRIHSVYKDSYQKVPRRMGFKPADHSQLAITDKGREKAFSIQNEKDDIANSHADAFTDHGGYAATYNFIAESFPELAPQAKEKAAHHTNLANSHKNRLAEYGSQVSSPTWEVFPDDPDVETAKNHIANNTNFEHRMDKFLQKPAMKDSDFKEPQGHVLELKPSFKKHELDLILDLVKFEFIFEHSKDVDIKKRAENNINLIKSTLHIEEEVKVPSGSHLKKLSILMKKELPPAAPKAHSDQIRQVAQNYANSKGLQLNHIPKGSIKVDPNRATKIAQAYHAMPHQPNHPDVQASYNALINETADQFNHIKNSGMKFSKIKPGMENPYKSSKDLFHDIRNNNHMWYFPTEQGFGSGQKTSVHPMLTPTKHKNADGTPMLANDVFRVVHDYFGHAKEGNGFGPHGEEHAWHNHKQMYSPLAQKAMTSETRGQNSWVNFGPHGEQNRKNPANTIYADQKAGLLPDWAHSHDKIQKSEDDLQKSVMRRIAPSKGHLDYSKEQKKQVKDWVDNYRYPDNFKMPENSKKRLLHKLHGKTEARRNPKTNEREFLLHRVWTIHPNEDFKGYSPSHDHTAWTYNLDTAKSFDNQWHTSSFPQETDVKHNIMSAWVPESAIHFAPDMSSKRPYGEHEVTVHNPDKLYHIDKPSSNNIQVAGVHHENADGHNIYYGIHAPKVKKSENFKKKYLPLIKGSLQRKNKFNPAQVSDEERFPTERWTSGYYSPENREKIPQLTGPGRTRALQKLHGQAHVRRNPETNEREFLLHRAMGNRELEGYKAGPDSMNHSFYSSWTPNKDIAHNFASMDYIEGEPSSHIVSAWVPESHIHHIPNQIGTMFGDFDRVEPQNKNQKPSRALRNEEKEVIVKPGVRQMHSVTNYTPDKQGFGQVSDYRQFKKSENWKKKYSSILTPTIKEGKQQKIYNTSHVLSHLDDTDPYGNGPSHIRSEISKVPHWKLAKIPIDRVMNHYDHSADTKMVGDEYGESDEEVAMQYAGKPSNSTPHLILNHHPSGDFYTLDGAHRLRAAHIRGDKHITAYIPAQIGLKKADPDFKEPKTPKFDLPHIDPSEPNMVHADYHGFGGAMHSLPGQRELIHGLDSEASEPLEGANYFTEGSTWHPNVLTGEKAIVKPASGTGKGDPNVQAKIGHLDTRGHNSARREVMYHNMANNYFGLGEHVPTTAGFTKKGKDYSAQKFVDAHPLLSSQYKQRQVPFPVEKQYESAIGKHAVSGNLHKLGLMDAIMGNNDRHRGNFMLGKKDNKIYLIDNGLAFDYDGHFMHKVPTYLLDAEEFGHGDKLHPEALRWLNNLDEKKALKMWDKYGFKKDHPSVQGFMTRLHNIKEAFKNKPDRDVINTLSSIANHNKKLDWSKMSDKTEKIDDENIEKGNFKTGLASLATAAAIATSPIQAQPQEQQPKPIIEQQASKPANVKDRILNSIIQVESSGGKNVKHDRLPASGIHQGARAYGKYGLTPVLIRETAKKHKDLMQKHPKLHTLKGQELHEYMQSNPGLEDKIASKHYDRLSKHFGHDPAKIGYAWLNGIVGTYRAMKAKKDLNDHWHVKKILKAYGK